MKKLIVLPLFLLIVINQTQAFSKAGQWNENKVIAHRGAWKSKQLPENSIAALKEAIRLNCYGSEFDVHLTKDDQMVVNHDPTFLGMSVSGSTYNELLSKKMPNGEFIPTLEAYLKAGMKQKKTKLILELKPQNQGTERDLFFAKQALELVKKLKAEAWVEYISFSYEICKYLATNAHGAPVYYLAGDKSPQELKTDGMAGADYHYSVFQQKNWLKESKEQGLKTNAWTVNGVWEMKWLLAHEVDFITTNEPELLFEVMSSDATAKGWKLKWADEFNGKGLPDPSKWTYDVGGSGWGNNELQYYTQADTLNAFVEKGNLHIVARKETKENRDFTSARLASRKKFDWTYGRVEVRAMLPEGKGIWSAIWMLPTDWKYGNWPRSGEIDVMEHVGYDPDSVHSTVHTKAFNHNIGTHLGNALKVDNVFTEYHVYAAEWYESHIDFFIDDRLVFTFKNSGKGIDEWPFDQNYHLLLNIAVGGNWGGKMGVSEQIFPATMKVDYVRVFQK